MTDIGINIRGIIFQLIPIVVLSIPMVIINYRIAKRKGRDPGLYAVFSIFPFINFMISIYLVSLPDAKVMELLKKIAYKIGVE